MLYDVYLSTAVFNTPLVLQILFRSHSQLQCLRPHFFVFSTCTLVTTQTNFTRRGSVSLFFQAILVTQSMSLAEDSNFSISFQKSVTTSSAFTYLSSVFLSSLISRYQYLSFHLPSVLYSQQQLSAFLPTFVLFVQCV